MIVRRGWTWNKNVINTAKRRKEPCAKLAKGLAYEGTKTLANKGAMRRRAMKGMFLLALHPTSCKQ